MKGYPEIKPVLEKEFIKLLDVAEKFLIADLIAKPKKDEYLI